MLGNVNRDVRLHHQLIYLQAPNASYVPALDDSNGMLGAHTGTMPDLTRTETRVLKLDTSSTLFFPMQSTSFFVRQASLGINRGYNSF
jgi:hypothetical protein